jgi:hypothetical protein
MGKINWHYDPYAAMYARQIAGVADQIGALGGALSTHSGLTDIGRGELGKIAQGQYGDTLLASQIRNETARGMQNLRSSYGLGTMALRLGGNQNAGRYYDRLYHKRASELQDAGADRLTRMLPEYLGQMGRYEQADNDLVMQRAALLGQQAGGLGQAAGVMRAGTYAKEKKGILDSLGSLAGIFGQVAGGLGALGV